MSMKRWHHKSRNGCLQCRQRRVKCDEGRPACRNCVRAETADGCTYRQNTTVPTRISSNNPGTPPRIPPAPGSPVPLSYRELELMHHFCISTSHAIEDEPTIASRMRDVAPKLLLPHSNLVGGLLGLTAAHLAYQRPYDKEPYIALAYSHLNHALVQSQHSLQNLSSSQLTPEYAGALCLTAICTSLTIQALPVVDPNQSSMTPIQRFITNFRAFRGISVVF
ncbi:Putative zn(2)-C6 fungal-type DNA-binding domain-containing protein [Septoria linicola]|uniref:Zn(2)-C6 fungal-type DNA-binding domain-containing protein n=1 Tax=Septoria linicola TaxID=215465 RepID=A0A9Q9EK03_9PEZI|nr:putative zn(2)-C6 fungal-type DNA-binding domain-containing protein [Septoria linicola]USW52739.1 Putative zn(2)-C6 fungal-type DNA-binding domain-containing protein [Septoria linicola]